MSSTVCGVKFSDTTAALIDHAASTDGWRVEAQHRRGASKGTGVVVYPPGGREASPPIAIYEEKARFNPAHYDNVRRQLYRAGLPPLPGDEARSQTTDPTDTEDPTVPKPPASTVTSVPAVDLRDVIAGSTSVEAASAVSGIVEGILLSAGTNPQIADLASMLIYGIQTWDAQQARPDAAATVPREEVDQAMALAAEAEAKATRLEKELTKADARAEKAVADCRDALRRAEAAEAQLAANEAVLGPLRTLLAGGKA